MTDCPAYLQARDIVRKHTWIHLNVRGRHRNIRILNRALETILDADLNRNVLDEVMEATDDVKRAIDGDADIIGRNHRDPDFEEKQAEAKANAKDFRDSKIREYLTDTALSAYAAKENAS